MFKKPLVVGMTLALASVAFVGCGTSNSSQGTDNKDTLVSKPDKLVVGFIPSQNAETLAAKAKPMGDMLTKELGIPVEVTVTTNYTGLIEGMAAKKIDVGFLSPVDYVFAHDKKKAVSVMLQTVRNGSPTYRAEFVKRADNKDIKTVKDIKGKKVAFVASTSAAGYTYPVAVMKNEGIDAEKDVTGTMAGGHDKALMALYRGDVDVATVFEDARTQITKEAPDAMQKLEVFQYTDPIPNDTVSIRNGFTDDYKKKVQDAFIKIMSTDEGKKIGKDIYSFDNLVPGDDKNFDPVRKVIELLGIQESK